MKTGSYLENRLDISLVPQLFASLVGYLIPWVLDQAANRRMHRKIVGLTSSSMH
jgi:hypothetical protein